MNLNQLEYFVTAAETLNFHEKRCGYPITSGRNRPALQGSRIPRCHFPSLSRCPEQDRS